MTSKIEHKSNSTYSTVGTVIADTSLSALSEISEILIQEEEAQTRLNISLDQARNKAIFQLTGELLGSNSNNEYDIDFVYKQSRPTQLERINAIADNAIIALNNILVNKESYNVVESSDE